MKETLFCSVHSHDWLQVKWQMTLSVLTAGISEQIVFLACLQQSTDLNAPFLSFNTCNILIYKTLGRPPPH